MSENLSEKWQADWLMKLLAWGPAVGLILARWVLGTEGELADISGLELTSKGFQVAIGLLLLVPVVILVWATACLRLRGRCGNFPYTPREVRLFVSIIGAGIWLVALFAAF